MTAYEMRISDWSSDVCSSDLGAGEVGDGAVDVAQRVEAEEANAEGLEVVGLVAHEGHAGGGLQAGGDELGAGLDAGIVGVADDHTGRAEALGGDAGEAARGKKAAHLFAEPFLRSEERRVGNDG